LIVLFWPQTDDSVGANVSVEDFLSKLKLKKKHPDLWALVRRTIEKAEKPGGLQALEDSEYLGSLRGIREPIWEFRIPPKNRRGGVVRIYFCFKRGSDCIICLDAELKKKVESSSQKIHSAQLKYREVI